MRVEEYGNVRVGGNCLSTEGPPICFHLHMSGLLHQSCVPEHIALVSSPGIPVTAEPKALVRIYSNFEVTILKAIARAALCWIIKVPAA